MADEQAPPLLSLHWVELPIRNFPDGYSRERRGGESFFHQGGRAWVGVGDKVLITNIDTFQRREKNTPVYQLFSSSSEISILALVYLRQMSYLISLHQKHLENIAYICIYRVIFFTGTPLKS